ncbi:hybrid sensor histidine kinase/response regulator [Pengzhenrongella sp.]|uniref:hybrid sensor histidine kinase/response regulator n=1 Tax=Pengzhenrongella sp. TaxID=2888820 RepID=UPI002F95748F
MSPLATAVAAAATTTAEPTTVRLVANIVEIAALLIAVVVLARRARDRNSAATRWALAMFAIFLVIVGLSFLPQMDPTSDSLALRLFIVVLLAMLLLIPYLLVRFAHSLGAVGRRSLVIASVLTALQLAGTLTFLRFPLTGASTSPWVKAYLALILGSWTVQSALAAIGLWRAGNGQPSVVRHRMRTLSPGAVILAVALLSGGIGGDTQSTPAQVIRALISVVAIGLLVLAFVVPAWLNAAWRAADLAEYGKAERVLMTAVTAMQVGSAIVPAVVRLFGARGAALLDAHGVPVAAQGLPPDELVALNDQLLAGDSSELFVVLDGGGIACRLTEGWLIVQIGAFAPVFGVTERSLLDRVASFVDLALHRCRLYEKEAESRRAAEVANAQLHQSQRLESIGQLAGGVAHDFNNLLAGIMNYAALAEDGLELQARRLGLDNDGGVTLLAQDVAETTTLAARAAQLTHQLLIFSRREVTKPEVLDLNAIVTDMEKLLRRSIGENIELQVVSSPALPRVKADRGQLEQVLMNLVVNARDSMPNGGTLRIETSGIDTDEDYARSLSITSGSYVCLTISDTGTGMSREIASRAFEPFFTTKRTGEGTGLGLATVYGIAVQAAGDVAIYSEEGVGTTIRFILPATHEEVATGAHRPPESDLTAQGETILLVEDEDMVREPARRILQGHGYTVFAAANADEALEVAHQLPGELALLLTDVIMPGRSGKELAAEIRILSPHTEILYMSGYSADLIVHQGVLDDGVNLIEKPFPAQGLLRRVREILDGEPRVLQDS